MKFAKYRNAEVGSRLKSSLKSRQPSKLEKPPWSFRLPEDIAWLFCLLPLGWFDGTPDRVATISLFLPLLAAFTVKILIQIVVEPLTQEVTYLLPVSDRKVRAQSYRNCVRPIIRGLVLAIPVGIFASGELCVLTSSLQAMLIFLALIAVLSVSFLPKMNWFPNFVIGLILILGAGSFYYMSFQSEPHFTGLARMLPWYHAFGSWTILAGVLAGAGILVALTKRYWESETPFSRTLFYEILGITFAGEMPEEDLSPTQKTTPISKTPSGLLEKKIWPLLSVKERGLAIAVGFCESSFFTTWIKINLALLVAYFGISYFSEDSWTIVTPILWIGAASFIFNLLSTHRPSSFYFLSAIHLSPQSVAARFYGVPAGLKTLEKLFWREGLYQWPLLALSMAVPLAALELHGEISTVGLLFLYTECLLAIILTYHACFWHLVISQWLSRKGLSAFFGLSIDALLAGCILLPLAITFFSYTAIKQGPNFTLLLIFLGGPAFLIPRTMIKFRIKNPRRDLITEV